MGKSAFENQALRLSALGVLFTLLFVNVAVAEELLFNGETLRAGQFLENGPYKFIMQADCNLVLYVNQNRALWNSATNGRGKNCRATLQNNGNLVITEGTNDVVWNSGTARGSNNYRLIMQDDGNVVIYGAAIWATNTVQTTSRTNLFN